MRYKASVPIILATDRLTLREPAASDAAALRDYHVRNRERFTPWEPVRSAEIDEHARWIAAVEQESCRTGHASVFCGFAGGALIAMVELNGFSAALPRSAMLSYSVDGAYEGRGFASEAVGAVVRYAFEDLGMALLCAHYHPDNARSERLLERLGFTIVARTPVVPELETLVRPQVLAQLAR